MRGGDEMDLKDKRIGFAMCGSFCTFSKAVNALTKLKETGADVIPIMSETAYSTDTRFGKAEDFNCRIEKITENTIIKSIKEAEPIGPRGLLDMLIVLPCTGNTLAKAASGIADSAVTMAIKAHLRNERPVLLGVSTNDGLGAAAENIGKLFARKNIYFIPFAQDDYIKKPNSLVALFDKLIPAAEAALDGKQLQPVIG
jgi:dipicolinate synthase subunit B